MTVCISSISCVKVFNIKELHPDQLKNVRELGRIIYACYKSCLMMLSVALNVYCSVFSSIFSIRRELAYKWDFPIFEDYGTEVSFP